MAKKRKGRAKTAKGGKTPVKKRPSRTSGARGQPTSNRVAADESTSRPLVVGGPPGSVGERSPLAHDLLVLYGELGRLGRATRDEDERRRVREQQDAIGVRFDEVIARVIRADTEEYREATIAVHAAASRIEAALADLSRVADAIVGAARVVDAVAKVVAPAVA